jgi:hypothetical protein
VTRRRVPKPPETTHGRGEPLKAWAHGTGSLYHLLTDDATWTITLTDGLLRRCMKDGKGSCRSLRPFNALSRLSSPDFAESTLTMIAHRVSDAKGCIARQLGAGDPR